MARDTQGVMVLGALAGLVAVILNGSTTGIIAVIIIGGILFKLLNEQF